MSTPIRDVWRILARSGGTAPETEPANVEIAPYDPLLPYLLSARGVVEIDRVDLDSPALRTLKEAGVKLTIPLVAQGELIGMLNLGPRLSEQEYSVDDRGLLSSLAIQAAPALRVAQLVRQQQEEARRLERLEQELQIARLIQQTLLPRELPQLPGWHLAAYYRPAREVGGDFYDFVQLPDGKLGVIVADVTDKGVPAALVMATTRSVLHAAAERLVSPAQVLSRVNDQLIPNMPENMFVTCLYSVLDPDSRTLRFANAGHGLAFRRGPGGVSELKATGMPLGLMPNMRYDENEVVISPGDTILLQSDGLAEAHNSRREMFGFPRVKQLMANHPGGTELINTLVAELKRFTAGGWEHEDDVTLVAIECSAVEQVPAGSRQAAGAVPAPLLPVEFSIPSRPGNERLAIEKVGETVRGLGLPTSRLEKLKTAVGEATMNAMEHGNKYQEDLPVHIRLEATDERLSVFITDQGGGHVIPEDTTPDLEAKLDGLQSPRGWGLFLIKNMVDDLKVTTDDRHHTVELVLRLKGGPDG
jgi:serine phosphatase RsbU (regulator of sigma subunit)/anti-sigma regulatory factor (Ser/Thr protein kinase)